MSRHAIFNPLVVLVLLICSTPAQAEVGAEQLVSDISQDVLERVRTYAPTYDNDPMVLQNELLQLLDPVIDFESFSRGVMGAYYDQATPAQRDKFMTAFKATLVDLYTSTLVIYELTKVSLRETVSVPPDGARVSVDVFTREDGSYVVQYNMRRDASGRWVARNIILDGVNIGLTYRNQFQSAMEAENQDLGRVIELWPELIDGR